MSIRKSIMQTIGSGGSPAIVGSFTLAAPAYTSIGIYSASNQKILLRTLYGNRYTPAGRNYIWWDGLDNAGNPIAISYVAKVLSHNVSVDWYQIGNTSTAQSGNTVIRSYSRFVNCVRYGNYLYVGEDFNEGRNRLGFKLNAAGDINANIDIGAQAGSSTNLTTIFVATNGTNVYWTGYDPYPQYSTNPDGQSWAFGTKVSDDTVTPFSSGTSIKCGLGVTYPYAFDIVANDPTNVPTGMCCDANWVWICHGTANVINIFDATTAAAQTPSSGWTNPKMITYHNKFGGRVFLINNGTIAMATIGANGALTIATLSLTNVPANILNLAIDNTNDILYATVGGSSQQVYKWDISASTPASAGTVAIGQAGGYQSTALVANDRFCFTDNQTGAAALQPYISAYGPTLYIGDTGCNRMQVYNSGGTSYSTTVQFMPTGYNTSNDCNNPLKVYCNGLEFTVALDGSWTFTRNFLPQMPDRFTGFIFRKVSTTGGRTLATVNDDSTVPAPTYVWELTDAGPVNTGYSPAPATYFFGYFDNNFNQVRTTGSSSVGGTPAVKFTPRTGYSGGVPTYGPETTTCTMQPLTASDAMIGGINGNFNAISSNNIGLVGNSTLTTACEYHIQGYDMSNGDLLWGNYQKTTNEDNLPFIGYHGQYVEPQWYDIGNYVRITIDALKCSGEIVYALYHGEFFQGRQTLKYALFMDNGLILRDFGKTAGDSLAIEPAGREYGGNAISFEASAYDNDTDVVTNGDEAIHGLHLWLVRNKTSIAVQTITFCPPATEPLAGVSLFNYVTLNTIISSVGNITVSGPETAGYTQQSGNSSPDKYAPDITMRMIASQNIGLTKTIKLTFSRSANITSNTFWGYMSFVDYYNANNVDDPDSILMAIDDNGRTIWQLGLVAYNNDWKLRANSTIIINTQDQNVIVNTLGKWQTFSAVTLANGNTTITYGDYPPVTVGLMDPLADPTKPKYFQMLVKDNDTFHYGTKVLATKLVRYADTV